MDMSHPKCWPLAVNFMLGGMPFFCASKSRFAFIEGRISFNGKIPQRKQDGSRHRVPWNQWTRGRVLSLTSSGINRRDRKKQKSCSCAAESFSYSARRLFDNMSLRSVESVPIQSETEEIAVSKDLHIKSAMTTRPMLAIWESVYLPNPVCMYRWSRLSPWNTPALYSTDKLHIRDLFLRVRAYPLLRRRISCRTFCTDKNPYYPPYGLHRLHGS